MTNKWSYSNGRTNYKTVETEVTIEWEELTGGYSWAAWALVSKMSGDRKVYGAYIDSGCSCYSSYDGDPEEMVSWFPSLKEAASSLSRDIKDSDGGEGEWANRPDDRAAVLASLSRAVMALR